MLLVPRPGFLLSVLCASLALIAAHAEEGAVTLDGPHGAAIAFSETEEGWRWIGFMTPAAPEGGWSISDRAVEFATLHRSALLSRAWELVEWTGQRLVLEQDAPKTGLRVRRIFSFGSAANVLRIETWIRSAEPGLVLARAGLLELRITDEAFAETGAAPASFPALGRFFFAGIEHVSGECHSGGDSVLLMQRPNLALDQTWQFVAAAVVGWVLPGTDGGPQGDKRIRQAFLDYLDTVRIKPDRMVLHSETWWTLPPPLYEKDVLNDIAALRRGFFERTGMFFDTYALDLGWSDPRTFWQVAGERFPNEFRTVNEQLNALGCRLGLWMSPGSAYPDGLSNSWLQSQGYEMTPFGAGLDQVPCFALGTRYQREFKTRIVDFARQYGLGHAIFDFINHRCDVPGHGHPVGPESRYAIDAGVADVLDGLRAVNPNIALEPMVCGYPPSPWWLMKTGFILGPAGDDVPFGQGPCPEWLESLITARDVAYRTSQETWIMPTQALETWDLVVQTPGEFENTAVMAIGRGRWFISSYIKPELMKPEDWDFFAALVRWARQNKENLVNAWMIGGRPENREAYGYMFRNAEKDLFCVRNPWIEHRAIELPGLAVDAGPRELRMIYPRRATLARMQPGEPGPVIDVAPYETVFLEAVPAGETTDVAAAPEAPVAEVFAGEPSISPALQRSDGEYFGIRYLWQGMLAVPEAGSAELCILVEGGPEVEHTSGRVLLANREVPVKRVASAGQFGAATDPSPDNWVWLIAPLPPGQTTFQLDLSVLAEDASIGVFLRGTAPAACDPEPDEGPVFPVFHPERRAWSQTLMPLKTLSSSSRVP